MIAAAMTSDYMGPNLNYRLTATQRMQRIFLETNKTTRGRCNEHASAR